MSRAVKISDGLLREVEEFIKVSKNKYKYASKRQFVDIAVSRLLEKEKKGMKRGDGKH